MAKSRMINTKFWMDDYISNLDPIEKLLFLYFLTNPASNICGIYELPMKNIALDTGIDKEMVQKILNRFSAENKIFYLNGWVGIRNFIKHQNQRSPQVQKGIFVELENAPEDIKLLVFSKGIDTLSHLNLNSNLNTNTNADGQSPSAKFSFEDMELASHLLELILKNTPTFKQPDLAKWAEQVRLMRERDNRTTDQIRLLIDWSQSSNFWQANILSTRKLREKFDTLVAQIKRDVNKEVIKKSNVAFA